MEEKRISLFDVSIRDEDLMVFDNVVYKVGKINSVLENVLRLNYAQLLLGHLNQQGASKFGLTNVDDSIPDIYSENYYDFKYLKLGSRDWKAGKVKIYLSGFLYSDESEITEQLKAGCYYPNIFLDDNDVISLKEDCLCKMKPIREVFSVIASNNIASNSNFASNITLHLAKSVVEFTKSNLFSNGKKCEFLRLGTSSWEPLIFGIQFTIDAIEDAPTVEKTILSGDIDSPLDEIRNASIEYH